MGIWIFGAVIMTLVYEFKRKQDCVENEGWIKGIVLCETNPMNRIEQSNIHFSYMIKGLSWPMYFFE